MCPPGSYTICSIIAKGLPVHRESELRKLNQIWTRLEDVILSVELLLRPRPRRTPSFWPLRESAVKLALRSKRDSLELPFLCCSLWASRDFPAFSLWTDLFLLRSCDRCRVSLPLSCSHARHVWNSGAEAQRFYSAPILPTHTLFCLLSLFNSFALRRRIPLSCLYG